MRRHPILSNQLLVIAVTTWMLINLIFRWLYWPIFQSNGAFGIPQPSFLDLTLVVACTIFSALSFSLIGLLLGSLHPNWGNLIIAFWAIISLITLEGDIGWYAMSKSHVTFGDLRLFATQNWHDHFGIQSHDIVRFCWIAFAHTVAISLIYFSDLRLRRYPGSSRSLARITTVCAYRYNFLILIALVIIGQCYTMTRRGDKQTHTVWDSVANANPYYVSAADAWIREKRLPAIFVRFNERIQVARNSTRMPDTGLTSHVSQRTLQTRPDILFVTVESWNANLVDEQSMPYFSSLAKNCHMGINHYSGANQTELGILSLLYGDPDVFFSGYREYAAVVKQSPYLLALGQLGYRVGRVVSDITQKNTIPRYLISFNQTEVVNRNDWENIDAIDARLRRAGPDFIHVHYYGTHYPYIHSPKFSMHRPETPPDFSYQGSNMARNRAEIINRYMNTLSELDEWIRNLLLRVNLKTTIVVITGDHGEEMFETGRLGHASTLETPQVRTPLAICGPDVPAVGRSAILTAHADIFPTVFEMLGENDRLSVIGQSILSKRESRIALVAKQNHGEVPVEWAVQSDLGTLYLSLGNDQKFVVTGGDSKLEAAFTGAASVTKVAEIERVIVETLLAAENELRAARRRNL